MQGTDNFERDNPYYGYWIYISTFGNMDIDVQIEMRILSYKEYKESKEKICHKKKDVI